MQVMCYHCRELKVRTVWGKNTVKISTMHKYCEHFGMCALDFFSCLSVSLSDRVCIFLNVSLLYVLFF